MDFLALSPHTSDDGAVDAGDNANMIPEQFEQLAAGRVRRHAQLERQLRRARRRWSGARTAPATTSTSSAAASSRRSRRGRFDLLYDEFLPGREQDGDAPIVQLNHPRTFRSEGNTSLDGNWDQVFDINLRDIPNNSDREKKFNDFGLDDYEPLKSELPRWIAGEAMPDRRDRAATTLANVEARRPAVRAAVRGPRRPRQRDRGTRTARTPSLIARPHDRRRSCATRASTATGTTTCSTASAPRRPRRTTTTSRTGAPATRRAPAIIARDADRGRAARRDRPARGLRERGRGADQSACTPTTASRWAASSSPAARPRRSTLFLSDADYTGAFTVAVYSGAIGGDAVRRGPAARGRPRRRLADDHRRAPGRRRAVLLPRDHGAEPGPDGVVRADLDRAAVSARPPRATPRSRWRAGSRA